MGEMCEGCTQFGERVAMGNADGYQDRPAPTRRFGRVGWAGGHSLWFVGLVLKKLRLLEQFEDV